MMPIVKVRVIENKVISPMTVAAEIALCLALHSKVEIDFMGEAPTIACCELQALFNFLSEQGFDLKNIQVNTGNMVERSDQVKVIHRPDFMYELTIYKDLAKKNKFEIKTIDYHFGHLVSRCNLPRLLISSFLFDNYPMQTLQTFHWRHNDDYHRMHLALEELIYHYGPNSSESRQAWKLIQNAPLLLEPPQKYPIVPFSHSDIIRASQFHKSFFVDIICETIHDDRNFFLTEKFWRAVMTRTPFILHGPQWVLENIRELGFQTFNHWWDEGYSQDPGLHRVIEIKKVIHYLAEKSLTEINCIYHDMNSVLEHNFQRFLSLTFDDLRKVFVKEV